MPWLRTWGTRSRPFAASQAGVPTATGVAGSTAPPTVGSNEAGCGPEVKGFDCMSLVQYAVYQATGIALPGDGSQPKGVGTVIAAQATIAEDTADAAAR